MENNASKIIQEFSVLPKKKKIAIIFILIICLSAGIAIPSLIGNLNTNSLRQTAITGTLSPTPSTTESVPASLTLSSDKTTYKTGETIIVSLNLDSGTYGVGAADFVINFDANLLKPVDVTPGNYFKTIANKSILSNQIKISTLAEITDSGIKFPKGKGTVATLQFQATGPTIQTGITIDAEKTIIASDGKNILGKTRDLTISIE